MITPIKVAWKGLHYVRLQIPSVMKVNRNRLFNVVASIVGKWFLLRMITLSVHEYNVHVVQNDTKLDRHSRSTNTRLKLKGFQILGERNETSSYIFAAFPRV